MSITKDFYVCPISGDRVYEHRAVVNGTPIAAQFTISRINGDSGGAPSLEYITRYLRDQIEQAAGALLYKGVR